MNHINLTRKNFHKHINELVDYMYKHDNVVNYINDILYYRNIQALCDRRAIYYEISRSEDFIHTPITHFDIIKKDVELMNKGFIRFDIDIQNNRRENCKLLKELFCLELETKIDKYNKLMYTFNMPIDVFENLLTLTNMTRNI